MARKYFLIPANYQTFDFERLFGEFFERNGKILWQYNPKNDPKNMEVGDVCYLYYSNLPDNTRRIILRAIITEIGEGDVCFDGKIVPCFAISDLKTINWKNSGKTKFTYEVLHEKYGINITRNKRQLKDERSGDKKLREKLEEYFENDNNKLNLEQLKQELVTKLRCALDSNNNDPTDNKKHITFKGKNGLNYFEVHHLIQQHISKKDESLTEAVYDEKNLIFLCPTCHKRIHYGRKEDVQKMLTTLYNRNDSFYDSNFMRYASNNGFNTVLEWLYSMYKVSRDD